MQLVREPFAAGRARPQTDRGPAGRAAVSRLPGAATTRQVVRTKSSPPAAPAAGPSAQSPPETPHTRTRPGTSSKTAAAPGTGSPTTKPGQQRRRPAAPAVSAAIASSCGSAATRRDGEPAQVSPAGMAWPLATSDCSTTRAPSPTLPPPGTTALVPTNAPAPIRIGADVQPAVLDHVAGSQCDIVTDAGARRRSRSGRAGRCGRAEVAAAPDAGPEQPQVERQQRRAGEYERRGSACNLRTSHQRQKYQPHSG